VGTLSLKADWIFSFKAIDRFSDYNVVLPVILRDLPDKTAQGKRVSLRASKAVSKPIRVTFYARAARVRK
jgi:hypothetical protein